MMRDRKDLSESLKKADFPVHFISGTEDQSVPVSISKKQMGLPKISTGTIFNNCAHMGMFERPIGTSASLLGFIQNIT